MFTMGPINYGPPSECALLNGFPSEAHDVYLRPWSILQVRYILLSGTRLPGRLPDWPAPNRTLCRGFTLILPSSAYLSMAQSIMFAVPTAPPPSATDNPALLCV